MGKLFTEGTGQAILTQITAQNAYLAALHGDKTNLQTTDKTSLVSAVNELVDWTGDGITYTGMLTLDSRFSNASMYINTCSRWGNTVSFALGMMFNLTWTGVVNVATLPEICKPGKRVAVPGMLGHSNSFFPFWVPVSAEGLITLGVSNSSVTFNYLWFWGTFEAGA
ncbi:MAG: hypothetical protein IJR68_01495 [Fretibacterium sp.]|nr:hypothetical protein [Fretibacterium sp.]